MRHGKRAIAIPNRAMQRRLENPKLPSGPLATQAWSDFHSQVADLNMERLRNADLPQDEEQFAKLGAKTFRNAKRQAYKR